MKTNIYSTSETNLRFATLPEETKTYKPVTHGELIDLTRESILKSGFEISHERYTAAKGGVVANGRFTIQNVRDNEMALEIGWQNSYNKSLSLKFAIGTRIFICENGCVSGDFGAFAKKHTGSVQEFAPLKIEEYIKQAGDAFFKIQKDRDALKQIEVDKARSAELVGLMFIEEEIITATQVGILAREIKNPSFDYGCEGSLWELYNHATYALKESHPSLWMQNHINVHDFFAKKFEKPSVEILPNPQMSIFDTIENE